MRSWERIRADDDLPCGFFRYEDRMDTGEDCDTTRMWYANKAELADIFKFYDGHYADARCPARFSGMVELLADLKAHGYGVPGV